MLHCLKRYNCSSSWNFRFVYRWMSLQAQSASSIPWPGIFLVPEGCFSSGTFHLTWFALIKTVQRVYVNTGSSTAEVFHPFFCTLSDGWNCAFRICIFHPTAFRLYQKYVCYFYSPHLSVVSPYTSIIRQMRQKYPIFLFQCICNLLALISCFLN